MFLTIIKEVFEEEEELLEAALFISFVSVRPSVCVYVCLLDMPVIITVQVEIAFSGFCLDISARRKK